tara:strand:+ start:192 stop:512 length:321 start_codon:yes stop_codon:yes gene_type:complete
MYDNESIRQMRQCTECNKGYIQNHFREKRMSKRGFPMSIKVTHKCDTCGHVEFKHDYTDEAKIDWQEYIDESAQSMRDFYKLKRLRKEGLIDDDKWNLLIDAGAVW